MSLWGKLAIIIDKQFLYKATAPKNNIFSLDDKENNFIKLMGNLN